MGSGWYSLTSDSLRKTKVSAHLRRLGHTNDHVIPSIVGTFGCGSRQWLPQILMLYSFEEPIFDKVLQTLDGLPSG